MADRPERPAVSVIMNCHNCSEYLREAIDSVYQQTFEDWEIVFWDNLSTDESPDIAKSYDSRLRYFRGTEFLPLGAARNMAVEKVAGRFIAFLDCDDIWMPEHLQLHISAFDEDTAVVYGNCIARDMSTGREYIPFNPGREFRSGSITKELCKKNFIWFQTVVARIEAVEKLEYAFDPMLLVAEDFDFLLRLSLIGKFKYITESTLVYRLHKSSLTTSKRHFYAHDFSYLLNRYKDTLETRMLKDLARQYLLTVRLDLGSAGFKVFPFLRLGFSLRQMLISLLFVLFPGEDIMALKAKLRKPLDLFDSLLERLKGGR